MTRSIPVALTIAGSDSSAGAGIQADLKTFEALGVYGLSAVTCVVAEIPGKVSRIEPVSVEMVREQIGVLVKNFPIAAIKTGLLCSAEIISAVAKSVFDLSRKVPLVVDPVITATGGDPLLKADAIETYKHELLPLATLITPNLDEAAQLLGGKIADRESHGTGCAYSAAITAGLATGMSLNDSIARAKKFVTACIANHFRWETNTGHHVDALSHAPDKL